MESSYDVTSLYNKGYQEGSISPQALHAWREIARVLFSHFPYSTWIDVGCGGGGLLKALQDVCGVRNVLGIEGSEAAIGLLPDVTILTHDLRTPYETLRRADVVTCFDVAEHVGAAETLVDTLCRLSVEWILFGAAPPGQDGLGHIDLREPEEWATLFQERGWRLCPGLTARVKEQLQQKDCNFLWWIEKNIQVFTLS